MNRLAIALVVIVAACGRSAAGAPSAKTSPTATAMATPSSSASLGVINRCATSQLQFSLGQTNGATGNEIVTVMVVNHGNSACYLGGYPGVEMLDSTGNHLGDAQRSTDSFFGTYPPPHRVDIQPGGTTSFISPGAESIRAPTAHRPSIRRA